MASDNSPIHRMRRSLTIIPESVCIHHRFDLLVVGHCATQFSDLVANSSADAPFIEEMVSPLQRRRSMTELACGCCANSTLFCVIGESLVRVHLHVIENFSESLPNIVEEAIAQHTCVVFLFWEVESDTIRDEATNMTLTEAALSDFRDRTLEMIFMPACCRPFATLIACDVKAHQEAPLRQFVEQGWSKVIDLGITFVSLPSLQSVDGIVTDLCAKLVAWQTKAVLPPPKKNAKGTPRNDDAKMTHGRSQCCTVA
eukprot:NODE_13245_length_1176_cov_9.236416.p1 GENE.NODE_13245_length_1176_cov_9.236416~~NODE_13245_length_1176_cov_9.236416.p1  ORF type:complete len:282 (+),score=37.72 NODE_13245_length_1176_cov_9.236416:79-846(+)